MKKIGTVILFFFILMYTGSDFVRASATKINVGIASSESSVYGKMISLLSRSPYLQLIERRDLAPLLKELALKQTGAVLGASDSRLKGIDYLIMVDRNQHEYHCRIVNTETGEIIVGFTGFIDNIADRCIERLETEVSLKSITDLKNESGLRVSINFRADSYSIGEKIEFTVISEDSDGYLYLLDIQPDGSVIVLLPNRQNANYKITEGESVLVPNDLGFTIKATEPAGEDKVIAIVTKRPINIFKFGLNAGDTITDVQGKTKGIFSRGMSVELSQLPAKDWGISSAPILIKK